MPQSAEQQSLAEIPLTELVACHECDLLMRKPAISDGESVECPRCGYELYNHRHQVVRRSLALVVAALLLYIPANFLPIMHLTLLGKLPMTRYGAVCSVCTTAACRVSPWWCS